MDKKEIECLKNIAKEIRVDIIEMLYRAGSGHAGGSLSSVEIIVSLYFKVMKVDPNFPQMVDRDRFILSKGHGAPALYAVLARRGYFDKRKLNTLRQVESILQGHPDMKRTPGVDFSSGSLGHGLSVGCGMALGARFAGIKNHVFVLLGDGELNEGQIWEAAMAASKFNLTNLIAIIDRNRLQLDGTTQEIMPLEPLKEKWKAFNWHVLEVDGHDISSLVHILENAKSYNKAPVVIIAETVKGKGVSFMENNYIWHGKPLSREEYQQALLELKANN